MSDHTPGIYVVQPKQEKPPVLVELVCSDGWEYWSAFGSDEDFGLAQEHILAGPFTVEQILGLRWIPVTERMPEPQTSLSDGWPCRVRHRDGDITLGRWDGDHWMVIWGREAYIPDDDEITHWTPNNAPTLPGGSVLDGLLDETVLFGDILTANETDQIREQTH